jgi:hypothetical protein
VVFDKIEEDEDSLELVNEFNKSQPFFKAFIRNDGFLELTHFVVCYAEDIYKDYGSEFLFRIVDLQENDAMKVLGQLTKSE